MDKIKKSLRTTSSKGVKKERGITLIALVVTIIILIILAAISVNMIFSENGLIATAKEAREHQANATVSEKAELDKGAEEAANIIASNGSGGTGNIDAETGWDLAKVNKVESEDKKIVPVPKGYTASTIEGEKSVADGFVIKEGSNGGATEGINEFVWVPVGKISDIYDSTNNAGQLWDFGSNSVGWKKTAEKQAYPTKQNSGNREPDVITGASVGSDSASGTQYDAVSTNLTQAGFSSDLNNDQKIDGKDFKIQLEKEFKEMKDSVEKYGGFYIGRYETGNLSQGTAVVQKGNEDIEGQTWYTQYKLSKTIGVNSNVKSSMIWGSQWDATLRWFQTSKKTEVSNFPTNSEGKGNYSGTQGSTDKIIPTGSNSKYAVNNIYDMAGNVFDWTIEAGFNNFRVDRGGYYKNVASVQPACFRSIVPAPSNQSYGSRSTLYISLNAE